MSIALPILRDSRQRDIIAAPGQTVFTFDQPLFDTADLAVYARTAAAANFNQLTDGFAVALSPGFANASVTFDAAPQPTSADPPIVVRLQGSRVQSRTFDVTRGGTINSKAIEAEFDKQAIILQELRRDLSSLLNSGLWGQPVAGAARIVTAAGDVVAADGDTTILLNKTVGEPTNINLPPALSRAGRPITVKDYKGDANVNAITFVSWTGETIEGFSAAAAAANGVAVISFSHGKKTLYPLISGGWYL